jgi:formylglycine-generating enzyme required for sulfatase activity
MAWRIAQGERLERLADSDAVRASWERARAAIATDERYGGLELAVQEGLVPLGPDPRSGLWEFAHALSGEVPERAADGELALGDESAVVLVLVPGGEFWLGADLDPPSIPGYPWTAVQPWDTRPVHLRRVEPFFLAECELTQGQWQRTVGSNPSSHSRDPRAASFPVETISWFAAWRELARAGLRLPSEAEWEYACRAGTRTTWFWGEDRLEVARFGNVKDLDAVWFGTLPREGPPPDPFQLSPTEYDLTQDPEPVFDGFASVAPVRSFLPNAWGFHDVIGNVFEWCEDVYILYPGADPGARAKDLPTREMRVIRGGASHRPAHTSATRSREAPDFAWQGVGVRPARSLDR